MLNKLFKLDFKWVVNKNVVIITAAALASAVLTRIFTPVQSPFGSFMRHFMTSVTLSLCFSILLNLLARTIVRFVRNFYRDESYLTHTLPVEKADLWRAKILTVVTTMLAAGVAVMIIFAVAFLNGEQWWWFRNLVHILRESGRWLAAGLIILTFLLEILYINLVVFCGILMGRKADEHKGLRVAAWIFGLYVVPQLVLMAGLFGLSKIDANYAALFAETGTTSPELVKSVLYIATPFYLVICLAAYRLGEKALERGVDVE